MELKYKNFVKILDDIIKKSLDTLADSREEVFNIAEGARNEYKRIEKEVEQLKIKILETIKQVEKLSKEEREARVRLAKVSGDFKKYNEEDIKKAYERANQIQIKLILKMEEEKQLRIRRDELERGLKNLLETINRAENLTSRIGAVMGYLEKDLCDLAENLKGIQKKQLMGIKIIQAQEEERKRVAREIHDGPAQVLANIIIRADICEKLLAAEDLEKAKEELRELKETVRQVLKEIRKIIYDLRPMALDDLGFIPALKRYVNQLQEEVDGDIDLVILGEEGNIPRHLDTILFRIVQEGLTNIKKHAGARNIKLKLEAGQEHINILIIDDGKGFDVEEVMAGHKITSGFGLTSMKERVGLIGGKLEIDSKPGGGTKLFVRVPQSE